MTSSHELLILRRQSAPSGDRIQSDVLHALPWLVLSDMCALCHTVLVYQCSVMTRELHLLIARAGWLWYVETDATLR